MRLATWMTHFDPLGGGNFDAQPYEVTADCDPIEYEPGDQLIFEYIGTGADIDMAYVPNGDGERQNGRIPYLDLPQ